MNTFSQVWVFSDTPSRLPELMNGAQALANQINTFVLNDADGAQAIQLGANHVWKLNGKPVLRAVMTALSPRARTAWARRRPKPVEQPVMNQTR